MFSWTIPTFIKGRKKELEESDLYEISKNDKSDKLGNILETTWEKECSLHQEDPSLWKALIKAFGTKFMCYGVLCIVLETLR